MVDRAQIERELDDFVEGDSWPEVDEATGDPVPVGSLQDANQVLRRLKRLNSEMEQVNAVAADDIARIKAWQADRVAGIERDIAWGERSVENFMRSLAQSKPNLRSQKLPSGTLKLREATERLVVTEEREFMEWAGVVFMAPDGTPNVSALTHPELVRVKAEVDKNALKALVRGPEEPQPEDGVVIASLLYGDGETTEIIPGVVIERDAHDKFNLILGSE